VRHPARRSASATPSSSTSREGLHVLSRIGILGGTFDPIHLGHLAAAATAIECGALDRLLLVPAGRPPHKGDALASVEDRLAMCRLAAADLPGAEVWDWEARRTGPSYTVETLRAFHSERPQDEPVLVLGWDAARDLRKWHQPEEVLAFARLLIVNRPGLTAPTEADLRSAGVDPGRATICLAATPDVAATRIRSLAERGESLAGLVPAAVETYIRAQGLYGARRETP
jgi:nicotinate-nucleotide adenylyltransferase